MDNTHRGLSSYQSLISLPVILNQIITLTIAAAGVILLAFSIDGITPTSRSMAVVIAITLVIKWINSRGRYRLSGISLLILLIIAIGYNAFLGEGMNDEAVIVFPLLIIFGGLVFGRTAVTRLTITLILVYIGLFIAQVLGWLVPNTAVPTPSTEDMVVGVIFLTLAGLILGVIMRVLEQNIENIIASEGDLEQAYEKTLQCWALALELRGHESKGHSERVTQMALEVARDFGLGEEDLKRVYHGALLHDIGKLGIADEILFKPGALTDEEMHEVRKHPVLVKDLLEEVPEILPARDIPYHHHERWDGTGYPEGRHTENIPLIARIFSVVDNWDALTHDQPYRQAWPHQKAIDYLRSHAGSKFDPQVVNVFLRLLNEGRLAV